MADRQNAEVGAVASQANQRHRDPSLAQLMDKCIAEVQRATDDEDWRECDGWVGRRVLWDGKGKQTYTYEIRGGKLCATDSGGPFVATVTMSVDTFLDLIDAILPGVSGKAGQGLERKHAARHIAYEGERWLVDSGRFRKVFYRIGSATGPGK